MTVLDRKAREEKEEEVLPYHDAMRRKGSRSTVSWHYSGCRKICPIYIKCINITALFCVQIRYLKIQTTRLCSARHPLSKTSSSFFLYPISILPFFHLLPFTFPYPSFPCSCHSLLSFSDVR